jgi:adenylate cyclase
MPEQVASVTLVSALRAGAVPQSHARAKGAIEATEEGLAIATEQRSPYHLSRANVLRAVNLVDSGRGRRDNADGACADRASQDRSELQSRTTCRAWPKRTRAGRIERAPSFADQAVAEVGRTGERWWEAEAQRSRGEILLLVGPGKRDEAERCFKKALACARRQEAIFWELHAAQSLASLWQAQGRADQARELLTSVHGQIAMAAVSRI